MTDLARAFSGMDYLEFFQKFGGSARTKHIYREPASLDENLSLGPPKRRFLLPPAAALPREFIRLCPWEMEYLFNVARHARIGILETGRFNGGSCFVMACAAPDIPIWSVDISPRDDERLKGLFAEHGVGKNVTLIVGDSQKSKYPQVGALDLLFIDGDHSFEGCWNDIVNWHDLLVPNGHLLFHDAYPLHGNYGVQEAIAKFMVEHREVEVVLTPFMGPYHWQNPAGSIAHLIRRA